MAEIEKLSLAQKLNLVRSESDVSVHAQENDLDVFDDDIYQAFLKSRQMTADANMIDFAFKNGTRESFAYSHLYRTRFDPSEGITLHFSDHDVHISGLRMLEGYRGVLNRRVLQVTEADKPTMQLAKANEAIVTELKIVQRDNSST